MTYFLLLPECIAVPTAHASIVLVTLEKHIYNFICHLVKAQGLLVCIGFTIGAHTAHINALDTIGYGAMGLDVLDYSKHRWFKNSYCNSSPHSSCHIVNNVHSEGKEDSHWVLLYCCKREVISEGHTIADSESWGASPYFEQYLIEWIHASWRCHSKLSWLTYRLFYAPFCIMMPGVKKSCRFQGNWFIIASFVSTAKRFLKCTLRACISTRQLCLASVQT